MRRDILLMIIILLLSGCSSVKVDNDYLVHEELYRVPIVKNKTWLRFIPADPFDAVYVRCPEEQSILVYEARFCKRFDHAKMTDEDYVKRLYLNTYFSFFDGFGCDGTQYSPVADKEFKKLVAPVKVNQEARQFSVEYETSIDNKLCGSNEGKTPVKAMDVFFDDPEKHYNLNWCRIWPI